MEDKYLISVAAGDGAKSRLNCSCSRIDVALQAGGIIARHVDVGVKECKGFGGQVGICRVRWQTGWMNLKNI